MYIDLPALRTVVQKNCHISDAKYARDDTLCVYLLKMREYFRWERGYSFRTPLSKSAVAEWLTERERLWETLQAAPFESLPVNGNGLDPFNTFRINETLLPEGLVYSGGLGRRAKPHFFLGRLERMHASEDYTILVSAEEYARDLTAPPAMTLDKTIFIRRESLRRMIWEKVEEWRWNKRDNPMSRAMAYYDFERDLESALDAMTGNELETLILHEIGEAQAGNRLGQDWQVLLALVSCSRAEILARAVRDHLADCLSTLPTLLKALDPASIHFYFANLGGMRKEIFPALTAAYHQWMDSGELDTLDNAVSAGADHWLKVAQHMLALYRQHQHRCLSPLEALIDDCRL